MVVAGEVVGFEYLVKFLEVASVKRHHSFGLEHALVFVQMITGGQRPKKPPETLDIPALLKHFANASHLRKKRWWRRRKVKEEEGDEDDEEFRQIIYLFTRYSISPLSNHSISIDHLLY